MMEHTRQRNVTIVSFSENPLANLSKDYASLHYVILQYYDWEDEVDKINISQLKSPFRRNWKIRPNLGQNYATLYLKISSKDLFEMLQDDGAQQVGKSDVGQLSKKIPLEQMGNFEQNWLRFLHPF